MAQSPSDTAQPKATPNTHMQRDEAAEGLGQGVHDRVDGGNASGKESVNFDDDEVYAGRGNTSRMGGTANAAGGDSGRIGPPGEMLSDRIGPSDEPLRDDDRRAGR